MNAERLNAVADALRDELRETGAAAILENMAAAFRALPGDPAQQQTVADLRRQLDEKLADAQSNEFSPAWRRAVNELDISNLLGSNLLASVEEILRRNDMTPVAAADEIEPIAQRARQLETALDQLHDGMDVLGIGAEVLEPGEFEIGFLIPRGEVHEEIDELAKEFHLLKLILGPFLEIATGTRGKTRVRSISSSDFGIFLEAAPQVIEHFSTALQSVLDAYEKVKGIRQANATMRGSGVLKEETLEEVQKQVDGFMGKEIGLIATELMKASREKDVGRRNELQNDLERALNGLANRIDRSYGIEIRSPELHEPVDEDTKESAEEKRVRKATEVVHAVQEQLVFPEPGAPPILSLPEPKEKAKAKRTNSPVKTRRKSQTTKKLPSGESDA